VVRLRKNKIELIDKIKTRLEISGISNPDIALEIARRWVR